MWKWILITFCFEDFSSVYYYKTKLKAFPKPWRQIAKTTPLKIKRTALKADASWLKIDMCIQRVKKKKLGGKKINVDFVASKVLFSNEKFFLRIMCFGMTCQFPWILNSWQPLANPK